MYWGCVKRWLRLFVLETIDCLSTWQCLQLVTASGTTILNVPLPSIQTSASDSHLTKLHHNPFCQIITDRQIYLGNIYWISNFWHLTILSALRSCSSGITDTHCLHLDDGYMSVLTTLSQRTKRVPHLITFASTMEISSSPNVTSHRDGTDDTNTTSNTCLCLHPRCLGVPVPRASTPQ